jgi:hypothetical protein
VDRLARPPVVATTTLTEPGVPLGTVTVIDVDPVVVTVADFPPTVTDAPVRWVPVMMTPVRPPVGPLDGEAVEIVGAAT